MTGSRTETRPHSSVGVFDQLDGERWLIRRLGEHGTTVLNGVTDEALRIERVRAAITENGLEHVICGSVKGKPSSYSQAFVRLYRQPLTRKSTRRGKRE